MKKLLIVFFLLLAPLLYAQRGGSGPSVSSDADHPLRHLAEDIETDTSKFHTNLSATDVTVQLALQTIDNFALGGGAGDITDVGDCASGDCFTEAGDGNILWFEGPTANAFEIKMTASDPTVDRNFIIDDVNITFGDVTDNHVLTWDEASKSWRGEASAGGATPPGGANTNVQYNDGGVFGGDANFTWTKGTTILDVTGTVTGTTVNAGAGGFSTGGDLTVADTGIMDDLTLREFSNGDETIDQILDDTLHHDVLDAITITDEGGLFISWTEGEIWDYDNKQVIETDVQVATQVTVDHAINFLYWDNSGGGTALTLNTTPPDDSDKDVLVGQMNVAGGDIHEVNHKPIYSTEVPALIEAFREIFPSVVTDGLVVSEHAGAAAFDVDMTQGVYYTAAYGREPISAQDSTVDKMCTWYKSAAGEWTEISGQTVIDTTQWNSGTGLVAVNANKYYVSAFFVDEDGINWLYPIVEYNTLNQAIAAADAKNVPPLPAGLTDHPYSTALVLRGNDAALPAVGDRWVDIRPIIGGVSGSISDHGNLAGLADDDHIQYGVLADAETILGNWDNSANPWDVSDETNLTVTAPITLTDDDVGITVLKDIVAGVGLTGGENDVLPGADADTTIDLDINGLGADTPVAADTFAFYDDNGADHNKVTLTNLATALKTPLDTVYLLLDASNDPVTNDLDITGDITASENVFAVGIYGSTVVSGATVEVVLANDPTLTFVSNGDDGGFHWEDTGDYMELFGADLGFVVFNPTDVTEFIQFYYSDTLDRSQIDSYDNDLVGTKPLYLYASEVAIWNSSLTAGLLSIYEDTDDGANFTSFTVPALAGNVAYTLPNAVGGAGEQLTDAAGNGILSWAAAGGAGGTPTAIEDGDADWGIESDLADGDPDIIMFELGGAYDKYNIGCPFTDTGIDALIDSLGAEGGMGILPEGTYTVTGDIDIDQSYTSVVGGGLATYIDATGSAVNVFDLNGNDRLLFRDFRVEGADGGGSGQDIIADNNVAVQYSTFQNLYIQDSDDEGVYFQHAQSNFNYFYGSVIRGSDGDGINAPGSYNHYIANLFYDNSNGLVSGSATSIIANNIRANNAAGIAGGGAYNRILGNYLYDNGTYGFSPSGNSLTFVGNVIHDNSSGGILLNGTDNAVIGVNVFSANGGNAINLDANSDNNMIIGNKVSDTVNIAAGATDNQYLWNLMGSNAVTDAGTGTVYANWDGDTPNGFWFYHQNSSPETLLTFGVKSGTPADNDYFDIVYNLTDDGPAQDDFAMKRILALDVSAGTEKGQILEYVADGTDGSMDEIMEKDINSITLSTGWDWNLVTKVASYTAANETVIICNAGANMTITLPPAATYPGRVYYVKRIDATAFTVDVDGNAAETIDGELTQDLLQWDCLAIVSDGTNWYVI